MFKMQLGRTQLIYLLGITLIEFVTISTAYADATDACFQLLTPYSYSIDATSYDRAVIEATALIKRKDISPAETRMAYLCLGSAYQTKGRPSDALPAFLKVEALSKTTEELAFAYTRLGSIYKALDELERAERYIKRAIKAYGQLGDKRHQADETYYLAALVKERGDVERAIALKEESLALEQNEIEKSAKLREIAAAYADMKKYDKAAQLMQHALDIDRSQDLEIAAAEDQVLLGDIFRRQGKLNRAFSELTGGMDAIRKVIRARGTVDSMGIEARACESLAKVSIARNDIQSAQAWYRSAEDAYRRIASDTEADKMRSDAAALRR